MGIENKLILDWVGVIYMQGVSIQLSVSLILSNMVQTLKW